jgi:hypothetical protein
MVIAKKIGFADDFIMRVLSPLAGEKLEFVRQKY